MASERLDRWYVIVFEVKNMGILEDNKMEHDNCL
jgi:hypothetical protein